MNEIKGTVATKGTLKGTLQGVYGKDGLSAYEVALKNGFEGTEQEWLASLKGADGAMSFEDLTEEQKASLKGDKGDRGLSGVYLGSGDMPEDCNVQIDPNGDALTVVADQTYSPTSTNAQSGKAVAEALANVGGREWKLIADITLETAKNVKVQHTKVFDEFDLQISTLDVPTENLKGATVSLWAYSRTKNVNIALATILTAGSQSRCFRIRGKLENGLWEIMAYNKANNWQSSEKVLFGTLASNSVEITDPLYMLAIEPYQSSFPAGTKYKMFVKEVAE